MTDVSAVQSDLACPACGGQRVWDPDLCALTCQSCGTPEKLYTSEKHKAAAEFAFDPDAPDTEMPELEPERTHQCQTCGGSVAFVGPALANRCPYCNGPVVLGTDDVAYRTMALIPFSVTLEEAASNVAQWIKARCAAPSDLNDAVGNGHPSSIYAPFWTFDSREAVRYWAMFKVRSGKNSRWKKASGNLTILFDDLLVPASPHVTPLIRDGILHDFRPENLKPYDAGYLSGFAAERHHQSVDKGLTSNKRDKDILIRNRIKRHINRQPVRNIEYRTDTSGIHYRRILLPVWVLHYQYGEKAMKVVVSGIDGRTFGERPFSLSKLAALSALFAGAAILLGLFWGSLGLP